MQTEDRTKPPISRVFFVLESGHIESWSADDIRRTPRGFEQACAEHRAAGRNPLVLRGKAHGDA